MTTPFVHYSDLCPGHWIRPQKNGTCRPLWRIEDYAYWGDGGSTEPCGKLAGCHPVTSAMLQPASVIVRFRQTMANPFLSSLEVANATRVVVHIMHGGPDGPDGITLSVEALTRL